MDSGGGNTGSSDPAKTSTVETATNSLPGCGCSSANNITVRVTPTTGGQFDLQVAKTESVENFKKLISKKLKVPKERICLLHRDRQLREGTLQENQLMDGSRLTLLPSVETGLLAQRPEQSVMQALESLNDTQVNDFLSGKAPLNLTMRLGDHMMLIQLQLSTVTPSSSRRSSGGSSNTTTTTTATSSSTTSTSTSSTSAPAAAATTSAPSPAAAASSFTASPSPSPSASLSKSYVGGAGLPVQLSPTLAAPSLSSVIASSPSLSSVIAAAAASAAASAAAAAAAASSSGSGSSSAGSSSGMGEPMMTNSRTAPPPSIPSSSGFAKAPVAAPAAAAAAAASSPRSSSSSFTTATTTSVAECAGVHQPASPAPCPAPAASPHTSPLKFLEEAASFLPKVTSSTDCPTAASTSSPSFTSPSTATSSSSSPSSCPASSSPPSSSFHTAQPSTSSSTPSTPPTPSPSSSPSSSSTTAAAATAGGASTTHACGYGNGGSGCKCETPAAKPMLDTRALAEASRNLTQTLKQLSSEVLTSRSDAAEDSPRGGRRQGAIIESMHHHGKGVYSGTFSGTLNPALQDRYGRPKRDISTIIHILNDLLCATPQYRRHTRQGHSISVEATGSTVPKKGTNTSDKNSSSLEYMEESGSLSRENQATRGKMEHLRLIMEERRARRRARREARAAPYTTQWSAKSESLPQSSAMGHDTVEPMETGEQSSSTASSEQQLCELNPPEPVVA